MERQENQKMLWLGYRVHTVLVNVAVTNAIIQVQIKWYVFTHLSTNFISIVI